MGRKKKISRIDYCQFLYATQTNYTQTYFAEHLEEISHDAINRYLLHDKLTPKLVWEHTKEEIILSPNGAILFDDTVLDKNSSQNIELARWQYSGAAGGVIKGIGVVTCIYFNPDCHKFWAIDYRIYSPDHDGKSKIDHLLEMFKNAIYAKKLDFKYVLMDSWYSSHKVMLSVNDEEKIFYCPLKSNRLVSAVDKKYFHEPVSGLIWTKEELHEGKRIHINKFPNSYHVKLFRIAVNNHRTELIVTNDLTQNAAKNVQKVCGFRWKIEQFHREIKQLTGVELCQCRKQRIQRNHIACSILVWVKLKNIAYKTGQSIYQMKENLLRNYMIEQLKSCKTRDVFA